MSETATIPAGTNGVVPDPVDEFGQRVAHGQPLQQADFDLLAGMVGGEAANRMAIRLDIERRKIKIPRRTFWQWWFGRNHEAPHPLPDTLGHLILRIQEGRPLSPEDMQKLVTWAGRKGAAALQRGLVNKKGGRQWLS